MMLHTRQHFIKTVLVYCIILSGLPLFGVDHKESFFSRWFGSKKTGGTSKVIQKSPQTTLRPIHESNIHEILDSKLTASVERISQHVQDVVASLENKIDQLQKQVELSKKEQKRTQALAQKRMIHEQVNKEIARQVSSLK